MDVTKGISAWRSSIERVPKPIRLITAVWLIVSLAFNFGLPSSTANLSPIFRAVLLLPSAVISVGLAIYILWQGGITLWRTGKCGFGNFTSTDGERWLSNAFVGGIGALNIYMVAYFSAVIGISRSLGNYDVTTLMSAAIVAGMILVLFKRKPLPSDVKIFLWSSGIITAFFAVLFITVSAPPTPIV